MKRLIKCRVTIFLILSWIVLSVIGYIGRNDIYKQYQGDVRTRPYFVLVFEGIHDGIWPWMMSAKPWESGTDAPEPDGPGGLAALPETEQEENGATEEPGTEQIAQTGEDGTESVLPGTEAAEPGTESVWETEETEPQPKEFVQVDRSYFDDAVFIGDSRTVGLRDYGGLDQATFYATVGMSVYDMWEDKFDVDGQKLTLEEALTAKQYGKVYFQIGINEMGTGTVDSFMVKYTEAVERLKELQPDAIIYVQGIMRVTQKKSDSDPIFNNRGIQLRNERIALLADQIRVFYIDMNEVVCNDAGNLREDLTFDDLHLYGSKYGIWVDFLLTKGIE